jgi:hypothetical protein
MADGGKLQNTARCFDQTRPKKYGKKNARLREDDTKLDAQLTMAQERRNDGVDH